MEILKQIGNKIEITCSIHKETYKLIYACHKNKSGFCTLCKREQKRKEQEIKFIQESIRIHNNFYDYSLVNYIDNNTHVKIICPIHGEFEQRPRRHGCESSKGGCSKCSEEKTYFKPGRSVGNETKEKVKALVKEKSLNLFKEKSKNLYNHIKIDYTTFTTMRTKSLKIICKFHGEDTIQPYAYLKRANGCKECTENLYSFSLTDFIKIANNKKTNIGKAILYVVKLYNKEEEFYKIGITTKTIKKRFHKHRIPNYDYKIIQEINDTAENIWKLEKFLLNLYREYKYVPKHKISGYTECIKL